MHKIYIPILPLFLLLSTYTHGQDRGTAPCSDTLFSIPFVETWDSGFAAHSWTFPYMQGNWTILTSEGSPAPCAAFTGLPSTSNYINDLVSPWFDATQLTCDKILLDFDLKLESLLDYGTEKLRVELEYDTITTVLDSLKNDSSFTWRHFQYRIHRVAGSFFRIHFIAYGTLSSRIQDWQADNISVTRKCMNPYLTGDGAGVCFDALWPCNMYLTWTRPDCSIPLIGQLINLVYDDGTWENGFRSEPGHVAWFGNLFPVSWTFDGFIQKISIYLVDNGLGSPQTLTIDIFDASHNLVGSSAPFIAAPLDLWIEVPITEIPVTGMFYAMLKWDNLSTESYFLAMDYDGPYSADDLAYYHEGSTWATVSSAMGTWPAVFLMRATLVEPYKHRKSGLRGSDSTIVTGYNVYRKRVYPDPDTAFVLQTPAPIQDTTYADYHVCEQYYGVTAVFSDGCESEMTVTEYPSYCYVGIDEKWNSSRITLSPCPASSRFTIFSDDPLINVLIMDLKGGNVIMKMAGNRNYNLNADISGIRPGIYLVNGSTTKGPFIKKLVIAPM